MSTEDQKSAYDMWRKNPTPENMNSVVTSLGKIINSEVGKYRGTLPTHMLQSYSKKYVIDAVKSYDPTKNTQLSTHVVTNLQRLHRLNYKNVQGLHINEEHQRFINKYLEARNVLMEELNKDPSVEQIAEYTGTTPEFIKKVVKSMKYEVPSKSITYSPTAFNIGQDNYVADYLYFDLPDTHKKIFEYKTGYNGSPILQNIEISKRLKLSPVRVTQIAESIANKFKKAVGETPQ